MWNSRPISSRSLYHSKDNYAVINDTINSKKTVNNYIFARVNTKTSSAKVKEKSLVQPNDRKTS